MTRTFERRVFNLTDVQIIRAKDKTGELKFRGRPWVYGQMSEDLGGWQEVIDGGAATRTLAANPDCRFLINHDANLLLARTTSSTLALSEDDEGGLAEADMADVSYARDLAVLIERGDLSQMSFGFWVTSDSWSGNLHRVREFDIDGGDVSAVTFPAFPQTSAELREYAERNLGAKPPAKRDLMSDIANAPIVDLTENGVEAFLSSLSPEQFSLSFDELRDGNPLTDEHETLVRSAIEALTNLVEAAPGHDADADGYAHERARQRLRTLDALSSL